MDDPAAGAPAADLQDDPDATRDLAILAQVGRSLLGSIDLNDQLDLTLRLTVDALQADRGSIMLLDPSANDLIVSAAQGLPVDAIGRPGSAGGIADWVAEHREPLVLHGGVSDPRFKGNDPSIGSSLSLPLMIGRTLLGVLNIVRRSNRRFTSHDLELAGSLADLASIAIEKSQMHAALKERQQKVSELLAELIGAQEKERKRIAADIHDGFLQDLSALFLRAENIRMLMKRGDPSHAETELEALQMMMKDQVQALREYIFEVRPTSLDEVGLIPTLQAMLDRASKEHAIRGHIELDGYQRMPETIETVLYRTAQEALRNVVKHSRAKQVKIRLQRTDGEVAMTIADDGRGMDPDTGPQGTQHFGIATMRERLEMAGGTFTIASQPGAGTKLTATVPLEGSVP